MRVMNPGPGEIVDRVTVVVRKIVEAQLIGWDCQHFEKELDELLDVNVWDNLIVSVTKLDYLLGATNAAIWQREDDLREARKTKNYEAAGRIAMENQELNDRRNRLVGELNAAYGIVREEKENG